MAVKSHHEKQERCVRGDADDLEQPRMDSNADDDDRGNDNQCQQVMNS